MLHLFASGRVPFALCAIHDRSEIKRVAVYTAKIERERRSCQDKAEVYLFVVAGAQRQVAAHDVTSIEVAGLGRISALEEGSNSEESQRDSADTPSAPGRNIKLSTAACVAREQIVFLRTRRLGIISGVRAAIHNNRHRRAMICKRSVFSRGIAPQAHIQILSGLISSGPWRLCRFSSAKRFVWRPDEK